MNAPDFTASLAEQRATIARLGDVDSPEAREEVAVAMWDTAAMLHLLEEHDESAAMLEDFFAFTAGHADEPDLFDVVEEALRFRLQRAQESGSPGAVEAARTALEHHQATAARAPADTRSPAELYSAAEQLIDQGEHQQAMLLIARALRPYEENDPLPVELAAIMRCYALLGSFAEQSAQTVGAATAYEEVLRLSEGSDDPDVASVAAWTRDRLSGLPR